MKYTHFIFDIDGTLVDTEKTGVLSLQKTIRDLMGREMDYEEVYPYFGIPSHKVAGMLGYAQEDFFLHTWERNFVDMRYLMKPFPGVEEMLEKLSAAGVKMGVVTSRSRKEVEDDPVFAKLAGVFDIVISAERTSRHKPDPEPLMAFMADASEAAGRRVLPEECLYLGDTAHDAGCAAGAGCDFALADWKGRGRQGIDARYMVRTAEDILRLA